VRDEEGFVRFLNAVGICLWMPHPSLDFPNLAEKMELDNPDNIWGTWFWKDDLHEAKRLYYGKLLGGRPTFVAMDFLPYVIAALGDVDPYTLHEQGRLTADALRIYEVLLRRRELSTGELRREVGLTGPGTKPVFEKAVTSLCALFQVCKTRITGRTRGTYGYRWGLVEDWIPDVLAEAAKLEPEEAVRAIVRRLHGMGVRPRPVHWRRLLGWGDEAVAWAEEEGA